MNLETCNEDMREVLASHLFTSRDKYYISGWFRASEGNSSVAHRLSELFAGRAETVELLAGDIRKAIEQGYTLKEIRDVLAQSGVSVSLARMQTLLGEGEKKGKPPVVDAVKDATGSSLEKTAPAPQSGGPSLTRYEDKDFVL